MGLWQQWRAARERRERAGRYLLALRPAAHTPDVSWLTSMGIAPADAARELLFAQRAIGLIVAERDALDDQTAADVAHEVGAEVQRGAAELAQRWQRRWRAYTEALAVRGSAEAPARRLARVLLEGAGISAPTEDQVLAATRVVQTLRGQANEALREVFGVASLPEDVRPSAIPHP